MIRIAGGFKRRSKKVGASLVGIILAIVLGNASAADVPAAETSPRLFYAEEIKAAMDMHVANSVDSENIFHLVDDKTEEALALKFIQVHDPVRQIGEDVYFACTDFHVEGEPDKIYDIDFWMNGDTGELKVFRTKVHKEPRHSLIYGWYKHPRYTFVNDEIKYLY